MNERIDDHDGRLNGPFASVVERERGRAGRLVPRLSTMFEEPTAGDAPEVLIEDELVDATRPSSRGEEPPRAADVGTGPDRSAPSAVEGDPVRHGHEVVHVERQVLVERHHASTPTDAGVDSLRSPRADPLTPDDVSGSVQWRSPTESDTRPGPRRPRRPADDDPPLRPAVSEPVVQAPESSDNQPDREQWGLPVVATRREVGVPRPEPERAPPALPQAAEPVVHVSIGRLEIRAVPDPAPPRTRRPERRVQSLDDYLERRNQGSGS